MIKITLIVLVTTLITEDTDVLVLFIYYSICWNFEFVLKFYILFAF